MIKSTLIKHFPPPLVKTENWVRKISNKVKLRNQIGLKKIQLYKKNNLGSHSLLFMITLLCKWLKTNQLQRNCLHLSSFHNNDAPGIISFNFPLQMFLWEKVLRIFTFYLLHIHLQNISFIENQGANVNQEETKTDKFGCRCDFRQ